MISISLKEASALALKSQFLDEGGGFTGKDGACAVIEELGYIQIDTISVIERAHHHTLWSRVKGYEPEMLNELLIERKVFEYWGHAASCLPMKDYRFYLPKKREFGDPHGKWEKDRLAKFGHLMEPALKRIQAEGPLGSKDFELPEGKKKGENWWDWHEMKAALELLYWKGELMVSERKNFHKIYDLTERVLPDGVNTEYPSEDELGRFIVIRALQAHGVASEKEIVGHIHAAGKKIIAEAIKNLLEEGTLAEVSIENLDGKLFYASTDDLETAEEIEIKKTVHILSPFDNLVIQRERLRNLFGFDYVLECYVPPKKRIHGYFVLPVLWSGRVVARMDAKADRKPKTLIIRSLLFEPGFKISGIFKKVFEKKLIDFAKFNKCDRIVFEKVSPAKHAVFDSIVLE